MIDLNNLHAVPEPIREMFTAAAESGNLPNYAEPKCYQCKNRGRVPGSAHSSCRFLGGAEGLLVASGITTWGGVAVPRVEIAGSQIPIVGLHRVGLRGGWAMWPLDFDPRWILWCIGYDPAES